VIEEIIGAANTHLVMHGSSSVPQDLQDIINEFGGQMPQTWGVPVEEIQRGIKHGVRKINIDTDNRMAMTGQIRRIFAQNPDEFDPRKYLKPAMEAMQKICRQRFAEFGAEGYAGQDQGASALGHGQALRLRRAGPEVRGFAEGGGVGGGRWRLAFSANYGYNDSHNSHGAAMSSYSVADARTPSRV